MTTHAPTATPSARSGLKRQEIARQLRGAILAGDYGDGTLLPGENELAQRFEVSRGTIRRALDSLVSDRLIDTRTGVGSFVTFDGHELNGQANTAGASGSGTTSWGTALADAGVNMHTEILRMELITDPELAISVGSSGMRFLAVDRVRHVSHGRAVSIERSRVPAVGPLTDAVTDGLVDNSLSSTMAAAGLIATCGEQWTSVAALNADDARTLGRRDGDPFLNTVRITRDDDGNFVEKVVSWLDPDRFRLHLTFGAQQ